MSRSTLAAVISVAASVSVIAAPTPPITPAKSLVAGLSDPSDAVRNSSAAALANRLDALPWLRRATRSTDKDTRRRAAALLVPHERIRQKSVAKALDVCVRDSRFDLFVEWHLYWQPEKKDDLWSVGPLITTAGLKVYDKRLLPAQANELEDFIFRLEGSDKHSFYDSLDGFDQRYANLGVWYVRAGRLDVCATGITFASIAGPIRHGLGGGGRLLSLGSVQASRLMLSFVGCDGDVWCGTSMSGRPEGVQAGSSVVVCRGNFYGRDIMDAVLLVDGDIDLTDASELRDSLVRASGEVRLPKGVQPKNCTIEVRAKNPTAPYKFFELADLGLSLADDEEGLVVTAVKPNTPFADAGLARGDVILAIDDDPAGHSEEFRKSVRRALVRQGDCLLTVARGGKTGDVPVFFPLPK